MAGRRLEDGVSLLVQEKAREQKAQNSPKVTGRRGESRPGQEARIKEQYVKKG